jgi:hypothetical protein
VYLRLKEKEGGLDMRWKAIPPFKYNCWGAWKRWFAWYPVKSDGWVYWLCFLERRQKFVVSHEYLGAICITEYRSARAQQKEE